MPAKMKMKFINILLKNAPVQSYDVDNFLNFQKKCSKKYFYKMAGTKVNLPFDAGSLLEALHFMPALRRLRTFFHLYILIYYTF